MKKLKSNSEEKDFDEIPEFNLNDINPDDLDDDLVDDLDDLDSEIIEIDDDLDSDIIIEIDEDIKSDIIKSVNDDVILSKHKIDGKHSLKYDSIFKGKKEDPLLDTDIESSIFSYNDTIEVDKSSYLHGESINNEDYFRSKLIKERVYDVLSKNTNLNFLNNRRKPSKVDFNSYYSLLHEKLKPDSFTNVEIFNELSFYFSDNLFNMFKLLDNKWRNLIIDELQQHIGKTSNSKEIINRNIYEGTEIEFSWVDDLGEYKIITGVVIEVYYEESKFKVDSYENLYTIDISNITKILNNTKFKYNLNKLNNIDFL
jgi:hypothetical protein